MSHFIRKCVLEKEIYQVDLEPSRDLQVLLSNATNNVNQIAHQMHIYGLETVKQQCFSIISEISRIITQVKNTCHDSED